MELEEKAGSREEIGESFFDGLVNILDMLKLWCQQDTKMALSGGMRKCGVVSPRVGWIFS